MTKVRLAVPSEGDGGLDGMRSGHFGHCDAFTCVDIEDGKIGEVQIIPNSNHAEGGCLVPVQTLARKKVNAIVVSGIGMRPLMGFQQAGIDVYYDTEHPEIRPVVEDFMAGKLPRISEEQTCQVEAGIATIERGVRPSWPVVLAGPAL